MNELDAGEDAGSPLALPAHLLAVLERTAVREAILRYATAVDRRDHRLLARCFTEDVHCVFEGQDIGRGVDKVIDYITANAAHMVILDFAHMLTNISVDLDGDRAHAESDALSYLITETDGETRIRLRGLRYVDDLVRSDGDWRICDHVHRPVWQHMLPVTVL